jgi:hypothetical protein
VVLVPLKAVKVRNDTYRVLRLRRTMHTMMMAKKSIWITSKRSMSTAQR